MDLAVVETYRKTREIDCEVFGVTFRIFGPSEVRIGTWKCEVLHILRQLNKGCKQIAVYCFLMSMCLSKHKLPKFGSCCLAALCHDAVNV
jgi:hypothetical protein